MKISRVLFWNLIIRIFLEGYLEFAIASFVNLKFVSSITVNVWQVNISTSGEVASSLLAVFFSLLVIACPILIALFIYKYFHLLGALPVQGRVGTIYAEYRTDSMLAA